MNPNHQAPVGIFPTLRNLHRREVGILPRVILSLAAGLLLTALAFLGGWLIALLEHDPTQSSFFYTRDEHMVVSFVGCAAAWLGSLVWIWRGMKQSKPLIPPALYTLSLWVVTAVALVGIEEATVSWTEDILMTATCCASGAITLLLWLPTIQRLRIGRPIVDGENLVNIHCPECGYSLIGLRELRCPECGAKFTIDELIRRQEYAAPGVVRENTLGEGAKRPEQAASQAVEATEQR